MLRKMFKVSLAGALGLLAVVLAESATVRAQDKKDKDEKKLTTKQIMGVGHKGTDALFSKVQAAVKAKVTYNQVNIAIVINVNWQYKIPPAFFIS